MKTIKNLKCFAFLLVLLTFITPTIHAKNLDETNTLTIVSENTKREGLLGFSYEVINEEGEIKQVISLEKTNVMSVSLPDGRYKIRNIQVPEGYEIEENIFIELPHEVEGGFTRELRLFVKHEVKKPIVKMEVPNPNTADEGLLLPISGLMLSGLGLAVAKRKNKG